MRLTPPCPPSPPPSPRSPRCPPMPVGTPEAGPGAGHTEPEPPGCAGSRGGGAESEVPQGVPCRSDAASTSHTERRMVGPRAAGGRAPRLRRQLSAGPAPGAATAPLGARSFKEPSAPPPRPAPPTRPDSPHDYLHPPLPPQPAARGTAARGSGGRRTRPAWSPGRPPCAAPA